MARSKNNTQNDTKTRKTPWRLEKKLYFCVFWIFLFSFLPHSSLHYRIITRLKKQLGTSKFT